MSYRRISFNVPEEAYSKLVQMFGSEHTSVSEAFRDLAYAITETPAELTASEKAQKERLEASEKRLAEKRANLRVEKEVPKNPFDKKDPVEKVRSSNVGNVESVESRKSQPQIVNAQKSSSLPPARSPFKK